MFECKFMIVEVRDLWFHLCIMLSIFILMPSHIIILPANQITILVLLNPLSFKWLKYITVLKQLQITTHFEDIPLDVLYDTLHDSDYRKIWDNMMIEEYGLCRLDRNCDVGYYASMNIY